MSNAGKPTFNVGRGGTALKEGKFGALSMQYSSRDMAAHTKLKFRAQGQKAPADLASQDFKQQLLQAERDSASKKARDSRLGNADEELEPPEKRLKVTLEVPADLDADDSDSSEEDDDDNNTTAVPSKGGAGVADSDDDDSEDDEAELMRELAKVKREREAEALQREAALSAERDRQNTTSVMHSNPLLSGAADFSVKRRWDDDVVFKNCAKDEVKKQHFINDTLRSEFHRNFMTKYLK